MSIFSDFFAKIMVLNLFFFKQASRGLFLFIFILFLVTISIIQIEKSVDGVLGIRTKGRRMIGTDKTTELWQPPMVLNLLLWQIWTASNAFQHANMPTVPMNWQELKTRVTWMSKDTFHRWLLESSDEKDQRSEKSKIKWNWLEPRSTSLEPSMLEPNT